MRRLTLSIRIDYLPDEFLPAVIDAELALVRDQLARIVPTPVVFTRWRKPAAGCSALTRVEMEMDQ